MKRRQLLGGILAVSLLSGCTGRPVETHGRLRVRDTVLVGEDGNPVQLTGMSSHGLQWYGWGDCLTTESLDVHEDWGADVLRLAMYTEAGGYLSDPEGFTEQVHTLVEECTRRDQYAIIDWHILEDGDPMEHVEAATGFFERMAERYAEYDNVIYEICNEPNGTRYDDPTTPVDWARIKEYADEVIPRIRDHDETGVIVVGTPGYSSLEDLESLKANPLADEDVLYSYHFYAAGDRGSGPTHDIGPFKKRLDEASDDIPVFVTEWGSMSWDGGGPSNFENSREMVDLMRDKDISWTFWNYSDDRLTSGIWAEGTCADGAWTDENLSDTGRWIRDRIRNH
ncbi:MAG: glycoside hydrolase family 5 protein [Halalkalicoccus sp.]|nr:glycoside hydrolase family 5 protein [Halalkalicoccus sp.]